MDGRNNQTRQTNLQDANFCAARYCDALRERTSQIVQSELQSDTPLRAFVSVDIAERSSSCAVTLVVPTWDDMTVVSKLLSSLAVVLRHLLLLNGSPAQKAGFWNAIFFSQMATSLPSKTEVKDWMLEDEQFPRRVVWRIAGHAGAVSEQLLKQIGAFLTAKPDRRHRELLRKFPDETEHSRKRKIAVGLVFRNLEAGASSVQLLQHLVLDQVGNSRGDQWLRLDMLDFSHNELSAEDLVAIADVLKKNDVYELEHVSLINVTGREEDLSSEMSSALTGIIQACFKGGSKGGSRARRDTSPRRSFILRLDDNYLRVEHYAALFSALRYDTAVREVGLAGTMSSDMDVHEREQCWRWIAFGLFYRTSAKTSGPRKINLSVSSFTVADTDAFAEALRSPEALLKYGDRSSVANSSPENTSACCELKKNSVVRRDPDPESEPILLVHDEDVRLECLRMNDDDGSGWCCVVVPGIGLGWCVPSQVAQAVDSQSPQHCDMLPEAAVVMNSVSWPDSLPLCSFVRTAGEQLVSLELRHNSCMADVVPAILSSCTNLQHLDLEGWITSFSDSSAYEPDVLELFQALRGDFGRQLLSLDLSGNRIGDAVVAVLAESLSSSTGTPALQHLRFRRSWMSERGLASLIDALNANKTISSLELSKPHGLAQPRSLLLQPMQLESTRLDRLFDGELLRCDSLPLEVKLAFLSVTRSNSAEGASARHSLDRWTVSSIFGFARLEVRRRIVWS